MLNKYKKYIALIILIFIGYIIYLHIKQNNLINQQSELQKQRTLLNEQLQNNNKILEKDKIEINNLQIKIDVKDYENKKLKQQLVAMPSTVTIPIINDDNDIKNRISILYHDDFILFDKPTNRFSIVYDTTSKMLFDAQSWITNGPLLQKKLDFSLNLNNQYESEIGDFKVLIVNKDKFISDLNDRDAIRNKVQINLDSQLINVNKQLKVERKNGTIKFIEGIIIGAATAAITNKVLKK